MSGIGETERTDGDPGSLLLAQTELHEDPTERLHQIVKETFWKRLTRRLDAGVISQAIQDDKSWTEDHVHRLYVPLQALSEFEYYSDIAQKHPALNLEVQRLPQSLTAKEYIALNEKPGLLALDTEDYLNSDTGEVERRAVPFIVPGGRFNEFFGWDSYFISLGLLADGITDLVKNVIRNWIFEIQHYGVIPNANRSYLMLRSQPPFLTDLCLRLYRATIGKEPEAKDFLKHGIQAAIKEYHSVWVNSPRLDPETGLSKYCPDGAGVPPEVDLDYFAPILEPFAQKHGMTCEELVKAFNAGKVDEPELETYFLHDRAVRESGHDTQSRLENKAADLAIIDLNCLLYKFETDIALVIREIFDGDFEITSDFALETSHVDAHSSTWDARAAARKAAMNKYLWNEDLGIFVDYNTRTKQQEAAESVTCFWALWCGAASEHQAGLLVQRGLPKFECIGGLASSSEATRAPNPKRPYGNQWDYPYGWAPHQMLAWDGLLRYGYHEEASRLAYKWLYAVLKVSVNYNGAIFEKYDVTSPIDPHKVDTEYPNQGSESEGFGWTNASYVCGLSLLDPAMKKALGDAITNSLVESPATVK